jgi:tight adherence protein C
MPDLMPLLTSPITIAFSFFLLFYGIISALGKQRETKQQVEQRLKKVSLLDRKKDEVLKQMSMQGSFTERVVQPLAKKLYQQFKTFLPIDDDAWAVKKLLHAGYTQQKYVQLFYGVQLLGIIAGACLLPFYGIFLLRLPLGLPILLLGFTGAFVGFYLPILVLSTKAQRRQENIQKSLPDFLELLVICVESGLGLDTAIQKIIQCQKKSPTTAPLREEWLRYLGDVEFGKPRREAMSALAHRSGNEDLRVLINSLILAYEMGSSIAHTLRIQCDTLRDKRMQRAEEKAQKVPVKMVPPIYMFMFPAIFVAIFGPMGMLVIKNIGSIMGSR